MPEHLVTPLPVLEAILTLQPVRPERLCQHLNIEQPHLDSLIHDLSAAGVPVDYHTEGYRIPSNELPDTGGLSPRDSMELLIALSLMEAQGWIDASRRDEWIRRLAPREAEEQWFQSLTEQVRTDAPVSALPSPEWMTRLTEAVTANQRLSMKYQPLASEESQWRDISPYTLVHRRESWYVIAYCHLREEIRTFKVNRIHEIKRSTEPFYLEPEFDPDRYLLYKWNILGGKHHVVLARFDAVIGPLILEKQLSHGKVWREEGFVYLQTIVSGLDEFGWWIMQYGEHAEVLQPRELRRTLALRTARMAERYRDGLHDRDPV